VGNEVFVKREGSPRSVSSAGSWCSGVISAVNAQEVKVLLFVTTTKIEWLRVARNSPDLKLQALGTDKEVSPCPSPARSVDSQESGVQIVYVQSRELCRSDAYITRYEIIDVSQSRSMNRNMFRIHHVPESQFSSRLEELAEKFAYSNKTIVFCDRDMEDSDDGWDTDDEDSDDDCSISHRTLCGVKFIRYLQANHPESTCTIRFLQGALL
jgi:hypothetical protein